MHSYQRLLPGILARPPRPQMRRLTATALLLSVIIVVVQLMAPSAAMTHAQTAPALATPAYGCSSPSDCLAKMTLAPKKRGR